MDVGPPRRNAHLPAVPTDYPPCPNVPPFWTAWSCPHFERPVTISTSDGRCCPNVYQVLP